MQLGHKKKKSMTKHLCNTNSLLPNVSLTFLLIFDWEITSAWQLHCLASSVLECLLICKIALTDRWIYITFETNKKNPIHSKHPYLCHSHKHSTSHLNNRSIQATFGHLVIFSSLSFILFFHSKNENKIKHWTKDKWLQPPAQNKMLSMFIHTTCIFLKQYFCLVFQLKKSKIHLKPVKFIWEAKTVRLLKKNSISDFFFLLPIVVSIVLFYGSRYVYIVQSLCIPLFLAI